VISLVARALAAPALYHDLFVVDSEANRARADVGRVNAMRVSSARHSMNEERKGDERPLAARSD